MGFVVVELEGGGVDILEDAERDFRDHVGVDARWRVVSEGGHGAVGVADEASDALGDDRLCLEGSGHAGGHAIHATF